MPNIQKYKSVAVHIKTWEKLLELAKKNHRSPSKQVSFLVEKEIDGVSQESK